MVDENPPFLPVGTEVSAKFKGAYCEARVKKVHRDLKVKVTIKENPPRSTVFSCSEFDSSTRFEVNEITKAVQDGKMYKCQIVSFKDASTYDVVFNDGDEKTLRRSQMVLKGKKHFPTEGNLDMMPLTNPESFSSPVIRGAAKRGAQKTKTMTSESDNRKRVAEDDDDEPVTKKAVSKQRGRDQRRRATTSSAAAHDREARSEDESSDEASEEKERRKRRDEDRAGPSTSSQISSDDELSSVPSTSNGANSAAKAEKLRLREIKLQEREEAKRKKDEERERKRSEKEEAKRKREADRNIKRAASRHNRDVKKLFKSAIVKAAERELKLFNRALARPSTRYVWRPMSLGKKRRRKKVLKRRGLVTLRNCRLCSEWMSVCRLLKMPSGTQRFHRWTRVTSENVNALTAANDFLKPEEAAKMAAKWLRGLENVRKWKFVVIFENPNKVRRLLPSLNLPACTFSERMDIAKGDVDATSLKRSLQRDEWYIGILLPQPYPASSSTDGVQRLVRHMATGELIRAWEDDLLPFSWVRNVVKEDMKYFAKQRPADRKNAFQQAWKFVTGWEKSRMCKQFMVARCGLRNHSYKRITAESGIPTTAPPPPQIYDDDEEESEESEVSESDSDSSIINAPDDEKAMYVALYMDYFDNRNASVPVLTIQSCDIDIFYFYQLVKRFGGPRKASAPGAHWTRFAKKLIPSAVAAEDELRAWFKTNLEPFMTIQSKLEIPFDSVLSRGDRKQVRPGQYSEARKRKSVTLQDVDHSGAPSTSAYSNARRGGRGGGRGRKRKTTPDERHRGKRERRSGSSRRGSRATTDSPEPEQLHEDAFQSDDDDTASSLFSADGSERKGSAYRQRRQKKTPTRKTGSRNSRSASARHDDLTPVVPAKKGRPRKHATSSANKQAKSVKPRESDLSGFVFANILSQVHTTQDLQACYTDGGWWAATAIADMDDFTDELMDVMLDHQATNPSYVTTMSSDTESRLKEIYDQLRVATHYRGWNQRYDEDMKLDKLMVKAEDQLESRRRFRRLPRGSELLPETMALVEEKMTTQHQIMDGLKTRPRVSREEFVRLAREALSSTKSKNEGAKPESKSKKLQDSDDDQPAPKEEEVDSDESDNDDDQPGPSSKGEKKKEEGSSDGDDGGDDGDDDDDDDDDDTVVMAPASKEEGQKRKSSDQYAERGFESESDEPEYPPGPSSPELLAMKPPILQNVTSLDRVSSSGSSNYPVLSRQTSNTSLNSSMQSIFSPSNSLSHSGPLTLAEVPPSESSSLAKHQQRHDDNEEDRGERVEPKGAGDTSDANPVHKKNRKNEADAFRALTSPIRTGPQFQSGALTLDIPQPVESSGPIEPTSSTRKGRKKTGTPVFQKPSPSITSSGPLTLSPSKTRPPGSSPLGRPKKKTQTEAAAPTSISTESDHEEEEVQPITQSEPAVPTSEAVTAGSVSGKESQEGTSGSTTPATIDDKEDDSTDKELDKTPQSTPRGLGSSSRGKRKRGGRFGGSYSTKPTKVVKRKEKDENEEEKDDDASSFVTPTPTHSARADSFQVQKNRMAKLMEQEGTSEAYHLLDALSDFDMTFASMHPEDIIMCLEERTTELRDAHGQCKQELSQLEKRVRLQNEAKRKAAEATTPTSSSSTNAPKN